MKKIYLTANSESDRKKAKKLREAEERELLARGVEVSKSVKIPSWLHPSHKDSVK